MPNKSGAKFVPVTDDVQVKKVAELAHEIWNEHYEEILGKEQIAYMLDMFQSEKALKNQMKNDNYRYFLINCDGEDCGYIGISSDNDRLFLSKLYLKKSFRSRGVASDAMKMLEDICRAEKLRAIWLTVNKYNLSSKAVYDKKGFKVIDDDVCDIGSGYVMDDYIMQKDII